MMTSQSLHVFVMSVATSNIIWGLDDGINL